MVFICEIIVVMASVVFDFLISLLTVGFGSTLASAKAKGRKRLGWALVALSAFYFLFSFARYFVPSLATPNLQPAFSWWIHILVVFVGLIGGAIANFEADTKKISVRGNSKKSTRLEDSEPEQALFIFAWIFSIAIVLGLLSISSSNSHGQTLSELACDTVLSHSTEEFTLNLNKLKEIGEDILDEEKLKSIPCFELE